MLVPKAVKVAGHTYKVIVNNAINAALHAEGLAGDAWHRRCLIRIANKDIQGNLLADTYIEETFIHEIVHAIDVQYNNCQLTEDQVERLSKGLQQVLGDLGWLPRNQKKTKVNSSNGKK